MLSAKISEKSVGKMKQMRLLGVLLVSIVALILGGTASQAQEVGEISGAEVFFEFNSTDLDLGFDIFLDGDPWVKATVTNDDGDIFIVDTGGGLEVKGNTEIMTESAEPPFCVDPEECSPEEIQEAIDKFQNNFPEGIYKFTVEFQAGGHLKTTAELSHDLPAAPEIRRPREGDRINKVKYIKWKDTSEGDDPEITSYEVVAEMVIDEETFKNTAILPGSARWFTISPEFMRLARRAKRRGELEEFKVEIVARAENLNKTITEQPVFEAAE